MRRRGPPTREWTAEPPRPATPSGVVWLSFSDPGSTLGPAVFDTFQSYSHLGAVQNLLEGERIGIKSMEMSIKS